MFEAARYILSFDMMDLDQVVRSTPSPPTGVDDTDGIRFGIVVPDQVPRQFTVLLLWRCHSRHVGTVQSFDRVPRDR